LKSEWHRVLLITFVAGNVAAFMFASLLDNIFDRYFLPLVIPLCGFLYLSLQPTRPMRSRRLAVSVVCFAVCSVLAILATHDYFAFAHARWAATTQLERNGVPPDVIDGGYEYSGVNLYDSNYKAHWPASWWWIKDDLYIIALGPLPGYQIIQEFDFPHWLWPSTSKVVILRRD